MPASLVHILPRESGQGEGSSSSEWLMIELQGEIAPAKRQRRDDGEEDEDDTDEDLRNGKWLGKLTHSDTNPQLVIGNAQLDGKRIKLVTPLALLKKHVTTTTSTTADGGEAPTTTYRHLGYVTEKYLFKTRPKPQSSSSSSSSS